MEVAEKIEFSEGEFKELHESYGSSNLKLQSEVYADLGQKQLDVYFKSIGFATTVIGVIGLIAGFGFTALDFVVNLYLFLLGEALLMIGLFYGLWWVQEVYQSEFNALEAQRDKFSKFYKNRNLMYVDLFNDWLETKSISRRALTDLKNIDNESIELYKNDIETTPPRIYSQTVYILMVLGTTCLLVSLVQR